MKNIHAQAAIAAAATGGIQPALYQMPPSHAPGMYPLVSSSSILLRAKAVTAFSTS